MSISGIFVFSMFIFCSFSAEQSLKADMLLLGTKCCKYLSSVLNCMFEMVNTNTFFVFKALPSFISYVISEIVLIILMDHLNITLTFVCKKVGTNEERRNQCHKSTFGISIVKSFYFWDLQNYTEVFPEHIEKKIV